MAEPWGWLVLMLGAPVGSFMAAYADRTCAGRSVLEPSRCNACGARLAVRDLIPVISFVALRGRCRHCDTPLSRWLLWAEIIGLACGIVAVAGAFGALHGAASAVFLWLLLGLAYCDVRCFRLPDALTLCLVLTGAVLTSDDPARVMSDGALGAVAGGGVLLALRVGYRRVRGHDGLGLGDVKLAAGLGFALGGPALPWVGLIAAVSALAAAAMGLFGPLRRTTRMPFGAFLALAGALVWGWQVFG